MSSDLHPLLTLTWLKSNPHPLRRECLHHRSRTDPSTEAIIEPPKLEGGRARSPHRPRAPTKHWLLRTRLVVIDCAGLFVSWVVLGYFLVNSYDTLHRMAPGACAAVVTLFAMRSVASTGPASARAEPTRSSGSSWPGCGAPRRLPWSSTISRTRTSSLGLFRCLCPGARAVPLAVRALAAGTAGQGPLASRRGACRIQRRRRPARHHAALRARTWVPGHRVIGECTSGAPWDTLRRAHRSVRFPISRRQPVQAES